jgi:hypothetical protein
LSAVSNIQTKPISGLRKIVIRRCYTFEWALLCSDRPLLGLRPSKSPAATSLQRLNLRLLGHFQSVVDLDAEIPDGAFEFGVSKVRGGVHEQNAPNHLNIQRDEPVERNATIGFLLRLGITAHDRLSASN